MIYLRAITKLLIGIMIFVGLPILGWGFKDIPGFLNHPARLGYAILAVLLQVFIVIRLPDVGSRRGKGRDTVFRQRLTILFLQIIPLALVIGAPYCDRRNIVVLADMSLIRHFGLGLFISGFLFMHWAEAVLDKQFSVEVTIQKDHKLITSGPYRYLRHPRYLGIIVFTTGISLTFRSWIGLILVGVLCLVLIWRIHDEEALLKKQFGPDWAAYCRKSWRLIPLIY